MKENHLAIIEEQAKHEDYKSIDRMLRPLSSDHLLTLLDSKSHKIGDTAAGLLDSRKETRKLIDALLNDRVRTTTGKLRASHVLNCYGTAIPEATAACVHLLDDRSSDVLSNALFGIVFMRRRDLIPRLREHLANSSKDVARQKHFQKAIDALEAGDPSLFSPGFHDVNNVWGVNNEIDEDAS